MENDKNLEIKKFYKNIGRKIRHVIKLFKCKRNALANYLGIKKITLFQYESAKRHIDIYKLKKISEFFELPIDFFITENYSPSQHININKNTQKVFESYNYIPDYNLQENLEFALEIALKTYFKGQKFSPENANILTQKILQEVKKISSSTPKDSL
ncbi:MAG: helix-turn-helix domain-containing protein [Candidatus Dojkabacteria bacterium]|nr:helix-turn-helix domain-containing protein [Candidatus Dojkabacteria bacterium]